MKFSRSFPYLLVLHGKHGKNYYHVDSEESLIESLEMIFDFNKESGYYYVNPNIKTEITELRTRTIELEKINTQVPGIEAITTEIKLKTRTLLNLKRQAVDQKTLQEILNGGILI